MRTVCSFLLGIILLSCGGREERSQTIDKPDSIDGNDTTSQLQNDDDSNPSLPSRVYSNERFRDVTVRNHGNNRFTISGKGQLFEANFGWVIEDGHNELMKGFETTDAGAPEWGDFQFSVEAQKQRPNSTLTLVLFETSAKDGSRQYELAIPLK